MTWVIARRARVGFVILIGTILTAGICGDAVAKAGKTRFYTRSFVSESRGRETGKSVQLVL
jgi:Pyruvate/2-oxoacid:ferredoxin oxidoreductase gamma subunit